MPFEKGNNLPRKSRAAVPPKGMVSRSGMDPWSVVLKVRSWAAQLREGGFRSCAEIARKEGITPARVSQLWPLSQLNKEQAGGAPPARRGRAISLRKLILIARKSDVKRDGPGLEYVVSG